MRTAGPDDAQSRLFLSADLVGSTARKQSNMEEWLVELLGFYQQFPVMVHEALDEGCRTYRRSGELDSLDLTLWKAVGDELVFTTPVSSEHHVRVAVASFVRALSSWSDRVLRKQQATLPLKGGAWIATFPDPDRAVAVLGDPESLIPKVFDPGREPEANNRTLLAAIERGELSSSTWNDFVGPSMDTGFRLASLATPRRFMVSLEVAWTYAEAGDGDGSLYFHGEVPMKGVWGGRGYPVFWLSTSHQHRGQTALDRITSTEPVPASLVRELARSLCNDDDSWVTKLYLPDSQIDDLRHHHEAVEDVVVRLQQVQDRQDEVPDLPEV